MEASFHVRLISTFTPHLVCAPAEANADEWLGSNHPDFDQFPVKDGNATVGVLVRRDGYRSQAVRDAMHPLREGIIVSADMPIQDLIPDLCVDHFRLVLNRGRIDGLVTQSDLMKLPVRMLVFGLVSHLEICLRALVRQLSPAANWLDRLPQHRRAALEQRRQALAADRLEPDLTEFTDFSDMVSALAGHPGLDDRFFVEVDGIRRLRNEVAHARTFIRSADDVRAFVNRFNSLRVWISHTTQLLPA